MAAGQDEPTKRHGGKSGKYEVVLERFLHHDATDQKLWASFLILDKTGY